MQSIFSGSVSKRGKSGKYIFFDHFPKPSGGFKIGPKSQPISTNIETAVLSSLIVQWSSHENIFLPIDPWSPNIVNCSLTLVLIQTVYRPRHHIHQQGSLWLLQPRNKVSDFLPHFQLWQLSLSKMTTRNLCRCFPIEIASNDSFFAEFGRTCLDFTRSDVHCRQGWAFVLLFNFLLCVAFKWSAEHRCPTKIEHRES